MKKLKFCAMFALLVLGGMGVFAALGNDAYAAKKCECPIDGQTCENSIAECGVGATNSNPDTKLMPTVQTAINVILSVVGVVAVVVLIVGGINFITSQGDTGKVAKARNTILYGVVGLIVALLSFAIVNFVLSSVFGNGETTQEEEEDDGPQD